MNDTRLTAEQIAEGEARDAEILRAWEAEREARMQNNANRAIRSGMSAEDAATRYCGKNWDGSMPAHIRVRHNLTGRGGR